MENKPIIRHCYNCKWCERGVIVSECSVKYEVIAAPRIEALFCVHYKKRGKTEWIEKKPKK